ncbi:ribosome biogenesis GTPase Der [Paraliomyxa miuraensis]|uniref:ribosome biogenesis GTPase Der n=1 Tax=Paraliomyxa miuraensis TaxID=376150 RepID=UPI00225B25CE|nr:ribosome biogenesis GTPase Der [Paraliomyxa miuraensis]MCX4244576.1 ribosome biogenesis GTPase Der [Paraliomyxa miuraensis]
MTDALDDAAGAGEGQTHGGAPLVAIVGRPNVGKSTLFNRLVGSRQAIVEDHPGVTRDRLYGVGRWVGQSFLVVDTGGIDPSLETGLPAHIQAQVEVAIEEADLILLVVDVLDGLTAVDLDIGEHLRRAGKPVLVVANKADSDARQRAAAAAWELGAGPVFAISAEHGRGVAELCDEIVARVGVDEVADPVPPGTRIAFIGRPNAGKSTLINTLLGSARVIVDDTPGTTRDAVYLPFRYRDEDLVLIDTAGLRRRKQVSRAQEKLAAIKSIRAMERTEVVVLVVDASAGVTDQDQRIARMAFTRGKGVVVLLHKWDLVASDKRRAQDVRAQAEEALAFLERPLMVRSSVLGEGRDQGQGRGRGLSEVLDACLRTARALSRRITTAELNEELARAVAEHAPPAHRGQLVKLYFATQADRTPPFIVVSANRGRCLDVAYERYLVRRFRKRWDLRGVPVRLVVRGRGRGEGEVDAGR